MHWVKYLKVPVFFFYHEIMPPNEDEFRVRDAILVSVRSANYVRPALAEVLPYEGHVHGIISPSQGRVVKQRRSLCDVNVLQLRVSFQRGHAQVATDAALLEPAKWRFDVNARM